MTERPYVSNKNETVRMFKSDFMEFFSHVHPAVPLVLYLPVIAYLLYLAFGPNRLSILVGGGLFLVGVTIWSLLEYVLHRYLFHYEAKSRFGKQLHFVIHGVHHDYPNDARRLVMPPVISIPVAVIFWLIFFGFCGRFAPAIGAGFGFGYVCYDSIHYAIHHFPMKSGLWRWLKQYHLRHHYHDDHIGFGVSSPLWDYVFGTTRKIARRDRSVD
jgi:sterol desaturase/sphingolipid hydroxylase (fatty acid hydroxylase superfamily)